MAKIRGKRFVFFTDPTVFTEIDKGKAKALSKWGAYVRRTARQSIKNRKGPSAPGQPPHSHEGSLRGLLNFYFDRMTKSVVVGPEIKTANSTGAPNILEFGGSVHKGPVVTQRVFHIGEKGPIRRKKSSNQRKSLVWVRLKTQEQCEMAKRIYDSQMRKKMEAINFHILPRPYMYPAMMKNLHVAPDCFRAILRGK